MIYFAYGSNMLRQRLVERVGEIEELGAARLDGYSLAFDKSGMDGSGKCTIVPNHDHVWGVAFGMDKAQQVILDDFEGPHYDIKNVQLTQSASTEVHIGPKTISAFVYIAPARHRSPAYKPWGWYRDFVLAGALQYQLPEQYVNGIRKTQYFHDPDRNRHDRNYQLIHASKVPVTKLG